MKENITTIYLKKHDYLRLIAGSPSKTEFLSKCLFWWQISTYKIRNCEYTWFTRTVDEIAKKTFLSTRTVSRYLSEFQEKGLIEKRTIKRYSKKHAQEITCLHIRITEKLQVLLKTSSKTNTNNVNATPSIQTECEVLDQIGITGNANLALPSINKDNIYNLTNNIVKDNPVNFVDKKTSQSKNIAFEIEKMIGERVTDELKDRVKGMLYNLEYKKNIRLFNKERLFSEIIFSLTNTQQLKDITCIKHKINIIAKKITEKKWSTPKGFYNHWDIGMIFKEKDEVKARKTKEQKRHEELLGITCPKAIAEINQRFSLCEQEEKRYEPLQANNNVNESSRIQKTLSSQLDEINKEIYHEGQHLNRLELSLSAGEKHVNQDLIDIVARQLASLYEQQDKLETQLNSIIEDYQYCA